MAKKKRKKYPNLPAGFGTIRYLGSGRRNCFAVHPPAAVNERGKAVRPPALCYVDDYVKGFVSSQPIKLVHTSQEWNEN